ncbi:NAD-dependent epimerase/dehydratase family protein, partial [Escherichia coli]|nr:NAD-dependent epimerase/dehydratase family protein [Escherichia coli]
DYYDVTIKEDRLKSIGTKNFTFHKINLEDDNAMNEIFTNEKPKVVINLAAQAGVRYSLENPRAYIDSNIVGFTNILECSRHHEVEHLIYA